MDQEITKWIRQWMIDNIRDYIDPFTDEVNNTALAEQAAIQLGQPEWLDDEQHVIWDLAVDVAGQIQNDQEMDARARMANDPINLHHPDCQCSRCQIGDDAYLWINHPNEY